MLVLRRNDARRHLKHVKNKVSQTFYHQSDSSLHVRSFGDLLRLDEIQISPGGALPSMEADADTFTYVHTGALEQKRSGRANVQRAGDFQRLNKSEPHDERNESRTQLARIFRLRIASGTPPQGDHAGGGCQQERFTAARRHNSLCTVASPNGESQSLMLRSDAFIYSSVVDLGHHLVHALKPRRCAWLHIVCGEATVGELDLSEGDGVGISESVSVSLTARQNSEILLVDLDATKLIP